METKTMSFRDTIILAMSEEMRRDENVFLMGEDVAAVEDVLRGVKYEREDVLKALKTIDITRYFAGISREEIAEAVVG